MGEQRHFKAGHKAPNDGVYIEFGETAESVMKNPKQVRLNKVTITLKTQTIIEFGS